MNQQRAYSTLLYYIQAFRYYFENNGLDNLTKDIQFKHFKSGIRRTLKGDSCPNASLNNF